MGYAFGIRTAGGNRLPDFGEEAIPVRGKVVSGVTRNPLSYSKDTLLCLSGHKNPYQTDWGYTCHNNPIKVSVARYPSAAQKKDEPGAAVRAGSIALPLGCKGRAFKPLKT